MRLLKAFGCAGLVVLVIGAIALAMAYADRIIGEHGSLIVLAVLVLIILTIGFYTRSKFTDDSWKNREDRDNNSINRNRKE